MADRLFLDELEDDRRVDLVYLDLPLPCLLKGLDIALRIKEDHSFFEIRVCGFHVSFDESFGLFVSKGKGVDKIPFLGNTRGLGRCFNFQYQLLSFFLDIHQRVNLESIRCCLETIWKNRKSYSPFLLAVQVKHHREISFPGLCC